MDSINFKATKIKLHDTPTVRERQPNKRYIDKDVSLLKLSRRKADINALHNLSELWDYEPNYLNSILINYEYCRDKSKIVYVISTQEENFRKLEPEKILGVAELTKSKKSYKINYIQSRPDCVKSKRARPYKGIGEAMMKPVITLTGRFRIYLDAVSEAVGFYKRLGFQIVQEDICAPLMVLIKNKKLH